VDDTEFCHPDGQLLVAAISGVKNQAMTRTVHGLEGPLLLFDVECEHDLFVILPMTGGFPELAVVHVWGDDCEDSE